MDIKKKKHDVSKWRKLLNNIEDIKESDTNNNTTYVPTRNRETLFA